MKSFFELSFGCVLLKVFNEGKVECYVQINRFLTAQSCRSSIPSLSSNFVKTCSADGWTCLATFHGHRIFVCWCWAVRRRSKNLFSGLFGLFNHYNATITIINFYHYNDLLAYHLVTFDRAHLQPRGFCGFLSKVKEGKIWKSQQFLY